MQTAVNNTGGQPSRTTSDALDVIVDIESVAMTYRAEDGRPISALSDVSFQIFRGEFISILGPSGCGKSTLMTIIAGLMKPTAGRVGLRTVGGRNQVGVVFQEALLFPWRNILENVELPGETAGMPKAERKEKAIELLHFVGLAGFEKKFPFELSGGMQQRVAIARALMLSPSLLLMDEPFGALDAMTRDQMNLELQKISHETKTTVVFVTHSIPEAAFLSDRVVVMSGRPACVAAIVEIHIPRPRRIELMNSDQLGRYVSDLRRHLEMKAVAQ